MIFDLQNLLSNAQAITTDAGSTNVIDLKATGIPYGNTQALKRDIGKGRKVPMLIQVVETFNTLTSMEIKIQSSDDPAFGSGVVDHYTTGAILLAKLVAGYQTSQDVLPTGGSTGFNRYLRVFYDITGTAPTLGKITAGIVAGVQTNGATY